MQQFEADLQGRPRHLGGQAPPPPLRPQRVPELDSSAPSIVTGRMPPRPINAPDSRSRRVQRRSRADPSARRPRVNRGHAQGWERCPNASTNRSSWCIATRSSASSAGRIRSRADDRSEQSDRVGDRSERAPGPAAVGPRPRLKVAGDGGPSPAGVRQARGSRDSSISWRAYPDRGAGKTRAEGTGRITVP